MPKYNLFIIIIVLSFIQYHSKPYKKILTKITKKANHLRNIDAVNINMVKNQNIALNPTKINGACGRLLCCFNYENEVYTECRKKLPKVKDIVEYKGKKGEVVSVDVLKKKYTLKFEDEEYKEVEVK